MPKTSTTEVQPKFSYDIFFTESDGYGAHIQIVSDSSDALVEGRRAILDTLKAIGATPRWQDEKKPAFTPTVAQSTPMERAAAQVFAGVSQDFPPTIQCPVDGKPMKLVPQGKYGPFYACDQRQGGCGKNVNAKTVRG